MSDQGLTPRQRLEAFAATFKAGRHAEAMALIDALIADFPKQAPLHWQRARALRNLGRRDEALVAVHRLIELKNDFAPAFLLRAELLNGGGSAETDLKRAIALDPASKDARLMLTRLLIGAERLSEADTVIDAALTADPLDARLHVERAHIELRRAALGFGDGPDDPDVRQLPSGHRVSISALQRAATHFAQALSIQPAAATRIEYARTLHQLGDYSASLLQLDAAEASGGLSAAQAQAVAEQRHLSRDNGAGEREAIAAAQAAMDIPTVAPSAPAPRDPSSAELRAALGAPIGLDKLALDIALSFYAQAHPAPLELVHTPLAAFPKFMREFAEFATATLSAHGFRHIADVDVLSYRDLTGQPTLLRIFASADGVTSAASYRTEPKWPGWLNYCLLRLLGKWVRPSVVDFETAFDDGGFLVTNNTAGVDPFAYRGLVDVLKLPVDTPIGAAFAKHRERVERYRREHPNATAQRADTFERVVVLQQRLAEAKAAFRRSIGYAEENELRQVLGEHYDAMRPRVRQKLDEIRALRERLSVER